MVDLFNKSYKCYDEVFGTISQNIRVENEWKKSSTAKSIFTSVKKKLKIARLSKNHFWDQDRKVFWPRKT